MIRGRLETLYSQGFLEGWAYDTDRPLRPLVVEVRGADGESIALGYAHLYRESLARAKHVGGWCGFRLRTARAPDLLRKVELGLYDTASGARIYYTEDVAFADGWAPEFEGGELGLTFDPFTIDRIEQLSGVGDIFDAFVHSHGAAAFIATAYVYTLGRSADAEGVALYGKMLRERSLTPFGLIELLADSKEFRSRPRQLGGAYRPGVPIRRGRRCWMTARLRFRCRRWNSRPSVRRARFFRRSDLAAAEFSPALRIAVELVTGICRESGFEPTFVARPEIFTHGESRAWLDKRLGGVKDHLALSDGTTIRLIPGLRNHVFLFGLGRAADGEALQRLERRAPELFGSLHSQVNTALQFGRRRETPAPIAIVGVDALEPEAPRVYAHGDQRRLG